MNPPTQVQITQLTTSREHTSQSILHWSQAPIHHFIKQIHSLLWLTILRITSNHRIPRNHIPLRHLIEELSC
uniref:Uncharacterized protein n=1 Tax=Rhizophora mucronata TaxID=61149 RepID=A0A2P2NR40_RHIMU